MSQPAFQCVCCRNNYSIFHVSHKEIPGKDRRVWLCHACAHGIIQKALEAVNLKGYASPRCWKQPLCRWHNGNLDLEFNPVMKVLSEHKCAKFLYARPQAKLVNHPLAQRHNAFNPACWSSLPYFHSPRRVLDAGRQLQLYLEKRPANPVRILDVGCGLGLAMRVWKFICQEIGVQSRVHGVEIDPARAKIAGPNAWVGDAFDYPHYHKFDVVFMYQPICDQTLMRALDALVMGRMRAGAMLFDAAPLVRHKPMVQALHDGNVDAWTFVSMPDEQYPEWRAVLYKEQE